MSECMKRTDKNPRLSIQDKRHQEYSIQKARIRMNLWEVAKTRSVEDVEKSQYKKEKNDHTKGTECSKCSLNVIMHRHERPR